MIKQVLKKLVFRYYLVYVATLIVAATGFQLHRSGLFIDPQSVFQTVISSALIILIIGSIPITLSVFSKKAKQWAVIEDVPTKLALYERGSTIRLIIIGSGFLLGVLFFFLMKPPASQSMIFCAGISAIALFFCKPAEVKIISDLQIEEPDKY
jgi:hypothetical protein